METLEELKKEFNKLNKKRGILFKKILELEDREHLKSLLLVIVIEIFIITILQRLLR